LKALHDILGIEQAVIVQASCHWPDNHAMLDAIKSSQSAYKGVCIANKDFTDNDFQDPHDSGVRAVRFNFVSHLGGTPDLDGIKNVLNRVKQLDWHLVIHVDAEDIITFEEFFLQFKMVIVVNHMGRVPCDLGTGQKTFQILKEFMQRDN